METSENTTPKQFFIGMALALVMLLGILYGKGLNGQFVNYDDDKILTKNTTVLEFDISKILFEKTAEDYIPLTLLTFAIENKFFGLDPFVYKLTNLILYFLNCIAVLVFIYWLTNKNYFVSATTTLLFAAHPLHVESVSWVTERKDVLFGVFYFLALCAYLKYLEKKEAALGYCFFFFILSCLSKSMAVIFPISCLAIDYYKKRKFNKSLVIEKIPFFFFSLFITIIHSKMHSSDELLTNSYGGIINHISRVINSFVFYTSRGLIPHHLAAYYSVNDAQPFWYDYAFTLIIISSVIYTYLKNKNIFRPLIFGLLFFYASLLPVSQIIPFGNFIAFGDRYFFMPGLGLIFSMVFAVTMIKQFQKQIFALILIFYSVTTFFRVDVWQNSGYLWRDVINKYPQTQMAYFNLGGHFLFEESNADDALVQYRRAIELKNNDPFTYFNMGLAYNKKGEINDAIHSFEQALYIAPNVYQINFNLGKLYLLKGNIDLAKKYLFKARELNPDNLEINETISRMNQ